MDATNREHGDFVERVGESRAEAAVFRRADLHVHSWGSDDYAGDEGEKEVKGFFSAAQLGEKGVEIVAITDHNRFKTAAELSAHAPPGLLVLPGMEISFRWHSVGDQYVHLILVCPAKTQVENVEPLFFGGDWEDHDERSDASVFRGITVDELVRRITVENGWVCIAAHPNSDAGGRHEARQSDVGLVTLRRERRELRALEKKGTASKEQIARLRAVEQKATEAENDLQNSWLKLIADCEFSGVEVQEGKDRVHYEGRHCSEIGIDPIACVVSSDAHAPDDIGTHGRFTYLKMGELSLDGIRRALADPGARVRYEGDRTRGEYHRILGMECVPLEGAGGEPFLSGATIGFSDDLSCLIGNRGAGKSTAIDALRFVFMEQVSQIEDERIRGDVARRIVRTLANSRVRVLVEGGAGELYVLWRDFTAERPSDEDLADREWHDVVDQMEETMVKRLDGSLDVGARRWRDVDEETDLKIELFGWSEIEHVATSRSEQLELIDIDVPNVEELENAIVDAKSGLRANDASLESEFRWILEKKPALTSLAARERDLRGLTSEAMEKVFEELDGVVNERQAIKKARTRLEKMESAVQAVMPSEEEVPAEARSEAVLESISNSMKDAVERQEAERDEASCEELGRRIDRVKRAYSELLSSLSSLSEFASGAGEYHRELEEDCRGRIEQRAEEAFREDIEAGQVTAEEVRERVWKREELRREVEKLRAVKRDSDRKKQKVRDLLSRRRQELRPELEEARRELTCSRQRTVNRAASVLEELSEDVEVVVGIEAGGDVSDWSGKLRGAFREADVGTVMNYVVNRYAERISRRMGPGEFVDHMLAPKADHAALKMDADGELAELSMDHARKLYDALSPNGSEDVDERCKRLSRLLELEQADVRDMPQIELNGRPVGELSPGQRCSALLPLVLLRGSWPVIVDQPEDNLDSEMVFNVVVDVLRALKQRRQVIVATHDPNVPVSGDAEQIVVMCGVSGDRGEVECQASVDDPKIIRRVTGIMEGGEEAFRKRAQKYSYRLVRV